MEESERAALYRLHASFCKTLADANRLLIINELGKTERTVTDLARRLGITQSNLSKHLALMREHGLVETRRDGINIYYRLTDSRISEAVRLLREVQAAQIEKQRLLAQANPL